METYTFLMHSGLNCIDKCSICISCLGFEAVSARVVTCDVIDLSYLHSVRSPSLPWQGASSVPNAGERRC